MILIVKQNNGNYKLKMHRLLNKKEGGIIAEQVAHYTAEVFIMSKLSGKKLILLGDREGVSNSSMEEALKNCGAEVVYSVTACFSCSALGTMDNKDQSGINDCVNQFGAMNCVAVLGSATTDCAIAYAEALTAGDPSGLGPLCDIALGLPVYSIFEKTIENETNKGVWDEKISILSLTLPSREIADAVEKIRSKNSRYKL